MRRYPSYKDSGVEWIGEIPENWGVGKLYQYSKMYSGSTPSRTVTEYWEDGSIPWMSSGEINKKKIKTIDGNITDLGHRKSNTPMLPIGTVMIGLNGQGKTKGTVGILEIETTCNQSLCGMVFNNYLIPIFSFYFLESQYYHLRGLVGEGQREGISVSFLSRYPLIIPPLSEQSQIVSYLDRKTEGIDKLIQTKVRKIELLKEYRTSIISKVVTKGLNPNVEMKDSGVEWIGEIPIHWELRKGSTIGYYSKGNGIKKDELRETGLPCIRYGEIYTKYNHKFERVETFIDEGITDIKVSTGTLFMTGSGELLEEIGKCVVYVGQEELYVGGDIIILKPFSEFDSEFLSYQINSECVRIQRELNGRGGIIVHIYSKNFKDMWFPTPSLSEQTQIVFYLDEQTQLIDKNIQTEERKIELLKEFRQSLISEVVTGKIKVCNDEEVH